MTKLISGRVPKIPSANVRADRYQFLELSEAEPDLGLPTQLGQVFTSDLSGNRYWTRLDTANVTESSGSLYYTNARVFANVSVMSINVFADVNLSNLSEGKALVFDGNVFIPVFVNSEVATVADIAGRVLSLENQTTANVREASSNLYYTNTRVFDAIAFVDTLNTKNLNVNGNLTITGTFTPTLAANGNVSAYATKYIVEYNPISKALTYSSTPDASNPYITGYSQEIHVSPVAFNDSGKGTIGDPVKTIAKAKQLLGPAFETTGVGQRKTIILHPGDYAEDVTIDTQYTVLTTHELIGKSTTLTGNLTLTTGCTIDGLKMARLIVTGTSANGTVDLIGCTVTTTATKTGTAYTVFKGCDLSSATLSITGAGTTVLNGGNYGAVTVNNASAGVLAKALITMGPTILTAGTLQISDTIVYSATNTSNAITQSAGSVLTFNNSQALIPDLTNVARMNLGGFYSILHSVYDKNNSTLSGTSLNAISYSQIINADSLNINSGGSITGANLISAAYVQANSWLGLYTANVVETAGNLYFTNARSRLAVSNSTGVYYDPVAGVFSIGQDVKTTSDVQFRDMTLSGNLFILGNVAIIAANTLQINDPLIQVGVQNPGDQWDLGWVGHYINSGKRYAGLFRDASDNGKFKFFSNTLIDSSNVNYIDTTEPTFRLSTVVVETLEGNVIGTVSSLANHNTNALAEGNVNLYYTNARTVQTVTPLLTTANVIESGTNLYYTNARVVTAVTPLLTTANVIELGNLYYTDARVFANVSLMSINVFADVDITNVSVNSTLIWDGTKFAPGASDTALRSNFANSASLANVSLTSNIANTVLSLSNFTTANLVEGTNLYFTNTRARTAFAPGKGISITSDGIINNTGAQSQYNLSINGTAGGNVLSTMSSVLTFPTVPSTDRFILRSLHVVNTSGSTAQISGNVLYATGNTAPIANLIPVAQGGVLEFIKTYQLFQPGDTINLQGFNSAGTATANLMTAMLTYETFTADQSFVGIGQIVANVDTNTLIYDSSQSYSIIESIKFINLQSSVVPIRAYWGDANGVPTAYLAYGLQVPPNSSIELLQGPKRINQNDRIYASYSGAPNAAVSVFVSARLGATYTIGPYVAAAPTGNSILAAFSTTDTEGTLLYYTIE